MQETRAAAEGTVTLDDFGKLRRDLNSNSSAVTGSHVCGFHIPSARTVLSREIPMAQFLMLAYDGPGIDSFLALGDVNRGHGAVRAGGMRHLGFHDLQNKQHFA